jgi:hypothetical protein
MRSRAARLILGAVAWIALAAAAYFAIDNENRIARRRAALRAFELNAYEAEQVLSDLRAAQQAYVAAGQGTGFWMPRVDSLVETGARLLDDLRRTAEGTSGRQSLMEAGATVTEFATVDKRARDYLKSGDELMAADVVFTEGAETAAAAGRLVESARRAEQQAFDAEEALRRRQQTRLSGAAAAVSALVIALLALVAPRRAQADVAVPYDVHAVGEPALDSMSLRTPPVDTSAPRHSVPALKAAAQLCTDIGRANDLADLTKLLGSAAEVMDASGVIVWLGNTSGADLRPVLAHGYPPHALSRMTSVAKSADNAAAAAYRTGVLQIVLSRPGVSNGAIVAPLLSGDGCIGALTAEIKGGSETADSVQALAAIFAAQLASVLAGSVAPAEAQREPKTGTA